MSDKLNNFLRFFLFKILFFIKYYDILILSNLNQGNRMKITDIKIRLVTKENDRLKAVASVVFDECFVLHDIKIIDGKLGLFIAMPSRKTPDGEYKDIAHPLNTETRDTINREVLAAYEKTVAEGALAKEA